MATLAFYIEGPDCVGKSALAAELVGRLRARGLRPKAYHSTPDTPTDYSLAQDPDVDIVIYDRLCDISGPVYSAGRMRKKERPKSIYSKYVPMTDEAADFAKDDVFAFHKCPVPLRGVYVEREGSCDAWAVGPELSPHGPGSTTDYMSILLCYDALKRRGLFDTVVHYDNKFGNWEEEGNRLADYVADLFEGLQQ